MLQQDFCDIEVLIADDCSSDGSRDIILRYCAKDSRIRGVVHPVNLGMVVNWNYCLKQARGRFIKYLFGDDALPDRQALTKLRALLERHPGASLAASARIILDSRSNVIAVNRTLAPGLHPGKKLITASLLEGGNLIGEPSAVMFRREEAQRGFDPAYRQLVDLEMWFHLLERGDLIYTPEPLCGFRRHALQQTAVNNSQFSIRELLMLVSSYGAKAWIPESQRLDILYRVRRGLRRDPGAASQFEELERRHAGGTGTPNYLPAKIKYALARPLENLRRAWQQRR